MGGPWLIWTFFVVIVAVIVTFVIFSVTVQISTRYPPVTYRGHDNTHTFGVQLEDHHIVSEHAQVMIILILLTHNWKTIQIVPEHAPSVRAC